MQSLTTAMQGMGACIAVKPMHNHACTSCSGNAISKMCANVYTHHQAERSNTHNDVHTHTTHTHNIMYVGFKTCS